MRLETSYVQLPETEAVFSILRSKVSDCYSLEEAFKGLVDFSSHGGCGVSDHPEASKEELIGGERSENGVGDDAGYKADNSDLLQVVGRGESQVELVGHVREQVGELVLEVVGVECGGRASNVGINGLNLGDVGPVLEVAPGDVGNSVDSKLHVKGELLLGLGIISAVELDLGEEAELECSMGWDQDLELDWTLTSHLDR